jgi:hypothetical protein
MGVCVGEISGGIGELSRMDGRTVVVTGGSSGVGYFDRGAARRRVDTHGKHEAARVLVHAVASPGVGNGDYWGPGGWMQLRGEAAKCTPHAKALDREAARRLVTLSEDLSGTAFGL